MSGESPRFVEQPTAHDYAAAARWALEQGDQPLAVEQAAAAVAKAADDPSILGAADEVLRALSEPLALTRLPERPFYGLCALRGRLLARLARTDEAVELVLRAATHSPAAPFVAWALAWTEAPKAARRVRPAMLGALVLSLLEAAEGQDILAVSPNLEAALTLVDRVMGTLSGQDPLAVVGSRLLRALGRPSEAEARLLSLPQPGWPVLVELAALARDGGHVSSRIALLERARQLRPDDTATDLDLGDSYLEDGNLGAAKGAYSRALGKEPGSGWAAASLAYAMKLGLEAGARPVGDDPRAEQLRADLAAYDTRLCDPVDPLIRVIRARPRNGGRLELVKVRADRPACPSALRAWELARPGVRWLVDAPDTALRLGALARQSGGNAAPPLLAALGQLLGKEYSWSAWCAEAARLAGEVAGCDFAPGMAASLPLPSAGADATRWVHGQQVAVALLMAHDADADRAEAGLCAVFEAADDWAAAGAVLGLRALGEREPSRRERVLRLLADFVPPPAEPLPPAARAVAIVGSELGRGEERRLFLRLRARALREAT